MTFDGYCDWNRIVISSNNFTFDSDLTWTGLDSKIDRLNAIVQLYFPTLQNKSLSIRRHMEKLSLLIFEGTSSPTKIHVVLKMAFNIPKMPKLLFHWLATIDISMNSSCTLPIAHARKCQIEKSEIAACYEKKTKKNEEIVRAVVMVMMTKNWCTFSLFFKSKGRHNVSQKLYKQMIIVFFFLCKSNIQLHDKKKQPF